VAPVSAAGATLPVAVSLARGDVPGPVVLTGLAVTFLGIVLASRQAVEPAAGGLRHPPTATGLALLAAACFGAFFLFLDEGGNAAGDGRLLWVVIGARAGSLPTLLAVVVGVWLSGRAGVLIRPARLLGAVAVTGLFDTSANVFFTFATTHGNLGVVAVLGSLYPVMTVILARIVLAERLARVQATGVALALAGVVLVSAG
jgi:drug/metabolite transporter (DMT)-like permease